VLGRGGLAELRLAPGRVFELSGPSGAEVSVSSTSSLRLQKGSVLAQLTSPGTIDTDGVSAVASKAAFRVDRGLSTRVASYRGKVGLASPGRSLELPRLRQAVVAAGELPGRERPIRINKSDRWDRKYLQAAIDLDSRLANFAQGLEAQLGRSSGPSLFSAVMPATPDLAFLDAYASQRRSDIVIGLIVASEAANNNGGGVGELFGPVFSLWSDGASWGLIAFEYGVGEQKLFAGLLEAVRRAGFRFTASGGLGGPLQQPGAGQSGASPSPSPGGGGGAFPSPSPSPSPVLPTTGVDPVDDIIEEVTDILPTPLPTPLPLP
ncbi:MAG: hypothetical protein ACRD1T_02630, partial [Acidimicrobiia bacterium]